MNRGNALREATRKLQSVDTSDAALDAQLLLAHVCDESRLSLLLTLAESLSNTQAESFQQLLALREGGLPLQYVLGEAHFMGHRFMVDERVLIPRWDTEVLCEAAISRVQSGVGMQTASRAKRDVRVLDIGTGSGAIAISIALACSSVQVVAVDISDDALAVARHNAARLGATVTCMQSDLYASLGAQRFDLIVSNPPYIPTQALSTLQQEVQREPLLALDGGADGLTYMKRIVAELPSRLEPGGSLLLEVGDGQSEQVAALLHGLFETIKVQRDLHQLARVVIGDDYAG